MRHSVDEYIAEVENIQLCTNISLENQNLIMYNNNYLTVICSSLSIPWTWTTLSTHGCSFGKLMFRDKVHFYHSNFLYALLYILFSRSSADKSLSLHPPSTTAIEAL